MRMMSGMTINGTQRSMERPREREVKGKDLSLKGSPKARMCRDRLLQGHHSLHLRKETDPNPLFTMMSTKSKPTWRHSTWNGIDYMICTVAEPQKKLPVFRDCKWSLIADSKVSLYGHDAKTMKNFTLHFDMNEQCDALESR